MFAEMGSAKCRSWSFSKSRLNTGLFTDSCTEPKIETQAELTKIPGLDAADSYYTAELAVLGQSIALEGKLWRRINGERVHVGLTHDFEFKGTTHIEIRTEEYELVEERSNLISIRMRTLTHNVTVAFSCAQPLRLNALVYGLTSKAIKRDVTNNMVIFTFPGWMLPGDGFQIDYHLS